MVAFEVKGGKKEAFRFLNALSIFKISNNLGDAKSLATHPSTTTHQRLTVEQRAELGIFDRSLRLSDRHRGCRGPEGGSRPGIARHPIEFLAALSVGGPYANFPPMPWHGVFPMCRNIKTLYNFEPPATEEEIYLSSLQFVRKLSGFQQAVAGQPARLRPSGDKVSAAARELIATLVTTVPPRDREIEAEKLRAKSIQRFGARAAARRGSTASRQA